MRVPESKLRDDICHSCQTDSARREEVVKEWLAHHPAPSWKGVATTLYGMDELRALQRLYASYIPCR